MATTKIITELTDLNAASSTSGLKMPSGGAFSGTATEGMMRNDTSQSSSSSASTMQFYNGTDWKNFVNTPGLVATENFSPVLYTGNGNSQVVTGLDFQPDLVWIKSRNQANKNVLTDVVRGTGFQVFTDSTDQESVNSNRITSFNSNGFTIGSGDSRINSNGVTYVAWCWKAGGTAVSVGNGSNTNTITQSANQDAGFSITQFTGATTGVGNFPHGLSTTPELVIVKSTSFIDSWFVWHKDLTSAAYAVRLNTTAAEQNNNGFWNSTAPDATSVTLGGGILVNTETYISYCFNSVPRYQKIGSYSGTGTNGNAITGVGFQPRWLLVKRKNAADNWVIVDSSRGVNNSLFTDDTSQELNNSGAVSFDSDGFTVNGNSGGWNNGSSTYLYLAIA